MLCTVGATHEGASRRTATALEARGPAGFRLRPVKMTVTSGTHEGASYAIRLLGCSAMLCTVGATHEGASRRTATALEARGPAGFRLRPVKVTVTSGTHEGAMVWP
jgi:hypothetical protein